MGPGVPALMAAISALLRAPRQGRAVVKSVLFIPQVFNMGIKPLEWFTPEPVVERVTFPTAGGAGEGDLFRPPGKGPYAAVLLFLGVQPAAASYPRVVNLGKALARSNLVTLSH